MSNEHSAIRSMVIDASVLLAAISPSEPGHTAAKDFLRQLHMKPVAIDVPVQFMLEVYAASRRSPRDVQQLGFMTSMSPLMVSAWSMSERDVEDFLAWLGASFSQPLPTRGGDLAYLWVAWKYNLPLVSLDKGMHAYASTGIRVLLPQAALGLL